MLNQSNKLEKPSLCYACGKSITNYSLLVCSECFGLEILISKQKEHLHGFVEGLSSLGRKCS